MLNRFVRLGAVTLSIITLIVYTQALMQDRMLVKALFRADSILCLATKKLSMLQVLVSLDW